MAYPHIRGQTEWKEKILLPPKEFQQRIRKFFPTISGQKDYKTRIALQLKNNQYIYLPDRELNLDAIEKYK
jgi:hypothetical protein